MFRVLVFLSFFILLAPRADAHPAPFSYLDLHLGDAGIDGSLVLHVIDVAHDLEIDDPSRLLDRSNAELQLARIVLLVSPRLVFAGDAGPLSPEWGAIEPLPQRSAVKVTFRLTGESRSQISVRARLFPYDAYHQTFLNIYEDGLLRHQAVFNATDPERVYYRGTAQGRLALVSTFVAAGIHHILIGSDHILFLVGLLLLGGGWRALVRIVTAFTVGHSITLSLAALNVVSPPASIVEPAIALSIVFIGADNLLVGNSGRDVRAWVALAFGLVHGFGFANVLREFGLPSEALAWSLAAFNIGVEIGQLLIVLAIAGALALVRRRSQVVAQRVAFAGSIVVIAAGAYWFVQRVFFSGGV